jgi:5-methyltetrahydropteroyltriglutamate--homocysteine methyltransferase
MPQPDWLIDREQLMGISPPRVRMRELWRVEARFLEAAQDDATVLAGRALEGVGIDSLTGGEVRRESYANRFSNALAGLDLDRPGIAHSRVGREISVPRVVGPIARKRPVLVRDVRVLRACTDRPIKMTLPGPFTMTKQLQNEHYPDERSLALALAEAVNEEVRDVFAAGADVVQIDEPLLQAWPEAARAYAVEAIDRALEGIAGTTALHTCFGYGHIVANRPAGYPFLAELNACRVHQLSIEGAQLNLDPAVLQAVSDKTIVLGVIDIVDLTVETAEQVAARIRSALKFVPPERLIPSTDCGMKYLPREVAAAKLDALVRGASIVREEIR